MKTTKLLRIASLVALLQYSAHAFLFLSAKPTHGQEEVTLVEAMKSHHWDFNGFTHSYWDFYFGYGVLVILWGFIEVILLWQIATLAKINSVRIRSVVALLFFANIAHAILALKYFFLIPAIFDFIVAIFLCLAFAKVQTNEDSK